MYPDLVCSVFVQRRALLTYIKRIYYPFLQQQPSMHSLPSGLIMLWTHTQPAILDAGAEAAVLAAAVIIPALANLAEAATAIHSIVAQQGMQLQSMPTDYGQCQQAIMPLTAALHGV